MGRELHMQPWFNEPQRTTLCTWFVVNSNQCWLEEVSDNDRCKY